MFKNIFLILILSNVIFLVGADNINSDTGRQVLSSAVDYGRPFLQISARNQANSFVYAYQSYEDQDGPTCCESLAGALTIVYIPFTLVAGCFIKSKIS